MAVPSAAAKGKKKASPFDLKITRVVVERVPGNPMYLLLDESDHTQTFSVTVTTRNYGAKVGPTDTYIKLELNGKRILWHGVAHLPGLRYRQSVERTWEVESLQSDPGLLEPVAIADAGHKITESNEGNNIKAAPIISVIPRDWSVSALQANVDLGNGLSGGTHTDDGFYFRFDHEDQAAKEFVYTGWGTVKAVTNYSGNGCSGQGTDSATQTPWSGSGDGLFIKTNLSQYSAGIVTDGQPPYMYQVSCGSPPSQIFFPQQGGWANLVTWQTDHSWIPMKFSDRTLGDSGQANTPQGHATYNWTFNARISGV